MAEEQTPKKVVKRVVKRAAPPRPPAMRYGRPVTGGSDASPIGSPAPTSTRVAARDEPASEPPTTPAGPTLRRPGTKRPAIKRPTVSAPKVDLAPAIGALRTRTAGAASAVGSRATRYGHATGDFAARRWDALRAWRIPRLEPVPAALLTGALVGLVSVGLGLAALALFTQVRGVASGGGTWGSLTFVVVTFIAFALGELLLTAFGTPMPRLTSFLGVVLVIMTILGLFLGVADSRFGIVLVPLLGAVAFTASHWLLALAESSPDEVG